MKSRTALRAALLSAALILGASACTVTANLTIPASEVATQAENAFKNDTGIIVELDCGPDRVDLVDGTKVECVASEPSTGKEFDAVVTLSGVDGTKYKLNVELVAER